MGSPHLSQLSYHPTKITLTIKSMTKKQEKKSMLQQVGKLIFESTPNDYIIDIPTGRGSFKVSALEYQDGYGKVPGRRPIEIKKNEYSEPE